MSITWNGTYFISCVDGGTNSVIRSTDGITWSQLANASALVQYGTCAASKNVLPITTAPGSVGSVTSTSAAIIVTNPSGPLVNIGTNFYWGQFTQTNANGNNRVISRTGILTTSVVVATLNTIDSTVKTLVAVPTANTITVTFFNAAGTASAPAATITYSIWVGAIA